MILYRIFLSNGLNKKNMWFTGLTDLAANTSWFVTIPRLLTNVTGMILFPSTKRQCCEDFASGAGVPKQMS